MMPVLSDDTQCTNNFWIVKFLFSDQHTTISVVTSASIWMDCQWILKDFFSSTLPTWQFDYTDCHIDPIRPVLFTCPHWLFTSSQLVPLLLTPPFLPLTWGIDLIVGDVYTLNPFTAVTSWLKCVILINLEGGESPGRSQHKTQTCERVRL